MGGLCPCPCVSERRSGGGPCPRSRASVVPNSQRRVRKPLRVQVCWVRGRRSSHANQPVDGGVQAAEDLVNLVVTRWGPGIPSPSDRCPPPTKKRSHPTHERVPIETEADDVIEAPPGEPQIRTILLQAGRPSALISKWRPDAVPPSFLVEPVDVLIALLLVPWMPVRPSHDPPQPWARQGVSRRIVGRAQDRTNSIANLRKGHEIPPVPMVRVQKTGAGVRLVVGDPHFAWNAPA